VGEAEGGAGAGGARARSAPVPRGRASDGQGGWVGLRTSAKGAVKVRHVTPRRVGWIFGRSRPVGCLGAGC